LKLKYLLHDYFYYTKGNFPVFTPDLTPRHWDEWGTGNRVFMKSKWQPWKLFSEVTMPTLYSGGDWFECWPGHLPCWLRFYVVYVGPSRRIPA
jgi:hypothetical protein